MVHGKDTEMMVSVIMITYGHEKYIEEAINGVFIQQTDFPVELIIANDCSPDQTDEVVKLLLRRAPENITVRYTKHQTNKGMNANFVWAASQATGKYIALCEGDDYWTDPLKLQKQVDFLEENEEYVACFHNAFIEDSISNTRYNYHNWDQSREVSPKEVIEIGGYVFPTASIIFRASSKIYPEKYCVAGDLSLSLDLLSQGKFYFMKDFMCVYRRHVNGIYSGIMKDNKKMQSLEVSVIQLIESKRRLFTKEYDTYFNSAIKAKYDRLFNKFNYPFYKIFFTFKYYSIKEILHFLKKKLIGK